MLKSRVMVPVGGVLILVLLPAAVLGQYFLNHGEGLKALICYGLAIADFTLLLYCQTRAKPLTFSLLARMPAIANSSSPDLSAKLQERLAHSLSLGLGWKRMAVWRRGLTAGAAILLCLAFYQVGAGKPAGPLTVCLWMGGLAAAACSVLPPATTSSLWWRQAAHRVLSSEGALVGSMLAAGFCLRMVDLAQVPSGIHGDESSFALVAVDILKGHLIDPFGPIFLADNALFAYLDAPFLAVFGQTVTGMRALGALSGALTLPAFYMPMRRMFGARPALLSLLLLVGNAAAVHFSRLALNVPQVSLFMCLAFWALWEGYRSQQAFWWLAGGMFGALPIYFHFSGLLVPPLVALVFAYLVLTQRNQRLLWMRGAAVALLGGVLASGPRILETLRGQYGSQEHVGSRFIFANWPRVTQAQHTTSPALVVLGQIRTNLLGFFNLQDASDFYTFAHAPLIAPFLGPLVALGLLLLLMRVRDGRYAVLTLWFWVVVIVGGALSIDSPSAHRLLPAVLPALAGIALLLDWAAQVGSMVVGNAFQAGLMIVVVAVPILGGVFDLSHYFGPAAAARPFEQATVQAEYIASLGPTYEVRVLGVPQMYFSSPDTRFLAPNAKGDDLANPIQDLPLPVSADRNMAFLVYGWTAPYLPLLHAAYPEGQLVPVPGRTGPVFTAFLVPREDIARRQGLSADYGGVQRLETNAASLGGRAPTYPVSATWSGSAYIDQPGNATLACSGARCKLDVDGQAVDSAKPHTVPPGWHSVRLSATLSNATDLVSLVRKASGQTQPVPTDHLDVRQLGGVLQGTVTPDGGDPIQRIDRALGSRDTWRMLSVGKPASATWHGALQVIQAGQYAFSLEADADASFIIDGEPLLRTGGGTANANRQLSAGVHQVEITYRSVRNPGMLELRWTPPGGMPAIIPPEAFAAPA